MTSGTVILETSLETLRKVVNGMSKNLIHEEAKHWLQLRPKKISDAEFKGMKRFLHAAPDFRFKGLGIDFRAIAADFIVISPTSSESLCPQY
jgi:hypothetical protein